MPTNALEDAFDEALDAAEEAKGQREKVTVQGVEMDALFGSQVDDFSPGAGGTTDDQPITVSVRTRAILALPVALATLDPAVVRGRALAVLSWMPLEGRYDLVLGDPATQLQ